MDSIGLLNLSSASAAANQMPRRSGRKRKSVDASALSLESAQRPKRRKDSANDQGYKPKSRTGFRTQTRTVHTTAKPTPTTKKNYQSKSRDKEDLVDLTGDERDVTRSPAAKESKKAKAENSAEKRLKSFRKQAHQKYEALMFRAVTQRMPIIERRRPNNEHCPHSKPNCPMEEVDLAGSTGNIYTVRITHVPECTCPDFTVRHNPQCKHILYVLVKVLKATEPLQYQQAFLTSELEEIFQHAGPLPSETVDVEDKDGKRKPIEGDCPICCEELSAEAESIVWCQAACGNNLHKSCFDQWAATKGQGRVSCPYCRTAWQNDVTDASVLKEVTKKKGKNKDGYVNVADQLGMSGRRDYSSYHTYWVDSRRRLGYIDDEEDY